ncbi:ABC transporter substrate-binding protein [Bradyrhizobium sp. Arg237L]|uniref:ABC transporter substrate-binding protein n=1 Tax=Bradyrhizobium sp. Arg237L TaxID=3003352 RepID=UPI00249E0CE1|nr:ABC transporter substrate-binding protein [Bradyrhizobium sp. Arg237L]MDI4234010.1 ABC transporter substrate-binding protein [Bradyrhizobium sp. Arg237L]
MIFSRVTPKVVNCFKGERLPGTFSFRRFFTITWLAAAAVLVQASQAPTQAADRVKVGLGIPPTVTEGSVQSIADELGLFRDENLDVEYVVLAGAGALLPQLLQKNITIALPLPETLLSAHKPGSEPLPVSYFYNAGPRNTLELAVKADSDIRTIADLRGKSIGVGALTWGTIPQTRALLRAAGLTPGKDVQIVAVGVLGAGFHALREDRVQALNFNSTWIDLLEQEGVAARRLAYPPAFRQTVVNGYIAHRSTLDDNPDLLERFGRAWTKALVVCDTNPRGCVEAFWRKNPSARPQGDAAAALAANVRLLQRWVEPLLRDSDGKARVPGAYDLNVIRTYVGEMYRYGEFASEDIPLDAYFSNKLVPGFVKFDRDALVARARALP